METNVRHAIWDRRGSCSLRLQDNDYRLEITQRWSLGSWVPTLRVTLPPTVVQHPKTIANHDPAIESSFASGKTDMCMQSPEMVLHPPLAKCDP